MTVFGLSEAALRITIFLSIFILCAAGEAIKPRRDRIFARYQRWFVNFSMLGFATLIVRLFSFFIPLIGAVAAAIYAETLGLGLLQWVEWPVWIELLIAILVLDFVIWGQHLVTHHVPLLWRLHRVHHSDPDIDASTALRFHPIEILFSATVKLTTILLIGPSAAAVILFEIILNGSAMFNHSNIKLPRRLDHILRKIVVTPDMHRVHHSIVREEHDRNFGFFLSVWDRIFGVYQAQPKAGHQAMVIGLDGCQDERPTHLGWSLKFPFSNT